jgi:cobyrinic acid a,c-diamide synthase
VSRIIIAGVASGVGKTTVTLALTDALRARGLKVAVFKHGPDYLDPTWHARASGRACHNLDGWMMGRAGVLRTFAAGSADTDISIIEGMMGLYDGVAPSSDEGSTAELARWLDAPVVVVADASAVARTLAAVGLGLRALDPALELAGLFANRVGGAAHLELLKEACRPHVPVVAGLAGDAALHLPERHLGLHAALDQPAPSWGDLLERAGAVDSLLAFARGARPLSISAPPPRRGAAICRIGIARDEAFHFYYADNLARLESLGAELVPFSPVHDTALPPVGALILGGGYPELHAAALAGNRSMRESLRAFSGPIYAECGGLMVLCRSLTTLDGARHEMAGLLDGDAVMTPRLQALGYAEVETTRPTPIGPAGTRFRGHQFRHGTLSTAPSSGGAYRVKSGAAEIREGFGDERILASWVHAHWASSPGCAESFVKAATR